MIFKNYKFVVSVAMLITLFGCATSKKAELSSSNPQKAIDEVTSMITSHQTNQYDLLANDEFENAKKSLIKAKKGLKNNDKASGVLDNLAIAKAYLVEAKSQAESRTQTPSRILKARESALKTKLLSSSELTDSLSDLDEELRDETENFSKELTPENFAIFQKKYLELEAKGVQHREIGGYEAIIQKALKNNADDLAPNTLKHAKEDLAAARNNIVQNPRKPSEYKESVAEVKKSSKLLDDVMNKLIGEAKGASEQVALNLVHQERKLGLLNNKVGKLEGELGQAQSNLKEMSTELTVKNAKILSAEQQIKFQQAMDDVRSNFSEEEAAVYQQGTQLIIRLKKLNFPSGSAKIPTDSMPLLAKVGEIIKRLDPKNIVVQGHTDSTGPSEFNQQLSMKRSETVSQYLSTLNESFAIDSQGHGAAKPIASNESSYGRSQNRRVDIVIMAR